MPDGCVDAVVKTFYVNSKHTIKVGLGCVLCVADVRDAGVIYQNVDTVLLKNFGKTGNDVCLIANVAGMG